MNAKTFHCVLATAAIENDTWYVVTVCMHVVALAKNVFVF